MNNPYFSKKHFTVSALFLLITIAAFLFYNTVFTPTLSNESCSTFLIQKNDSILVAHNLDEYVEVPGAIFINKRNIKKENIAWDDFTGSHKSNKIARIQWISKYGSITYNTWGKEFIDGGVNEKGLYIGEMTLMMTKWLSSDLPAFHHHFFMQYILDNFATVDEVIENMTKISINGHCKWHYFVADKSGKTAIIEYIKDSMKIFKDKTMPVQVLCNRSYEKELKMIPDNEYSYDTLLKNRYEEKDLRLMYASKMIRQYNEKSGSPLVDYSFMVLKNMGFGNTKWSLVYDLKNLKLFFKTNHSQKIKTLSFNSFDFSNSTPVKLFDIHTDIEGDVCNKFMNYTEEINKQLIDKNFEKIDFGFWGSLFFKNKYKTRINEYANSFSAIK